MTGSALLAGATLSEGLGILILGAAFAWLVGSETAARTYHRLQAFPGKMWPWVRMVLLFTVGGCLLVPVSVYSNFNSFLVAAVMSAFGVFISPFRHLPTTRWWLKLILWAVAFVAFFFAATGAMMLSSTAQQSAERIGEQAAYGMIALSIGMLWLVKGWNLIVTGVSTVPVGADMSLGVSESQKRSRWLYASLIIGVVILTLCLGLLTFSAFSEAVFPPQDKATLKSPGLPPFVILTLLAWWPYACWARILAREPNTGPGNARRHKHVTVLLASFLVIVLCVAITFGTQNGSDRMLTAEVENGMKGFQDIAAKIGSLKTEELRTTKNYIEVYEEMEPLLDEFDAKLKHFDDVLSEASRRYRDRGPLNIQRIYSNEQQWLVWDSQMFSLLHQDAALNRKQVAVVKQMAELPEEEQVEFWQKNFQPLVDEEDAIRQELATAKAAMPAPVK